ncbi:helix-turn-helix domain-containing protein [Parafilimonas sp.]|uniref:helix-turn-helix domain-containing protein n=1 Tax=Parafilimonas sp. TaxID=1969739 RepID=UPI0039E3D4C8
MSYKISLSVKEQRELKDLLQKTEQAKILKRYQCIHFKRQGLTNKTIADLLCVHIDTITDWLKIFIEGGLKGLSVLDYEGRRISHLDEIKDDVSAYVDKKIVSSIKELQGYILQKHQLAVEHSWLFRYCKKNSIVLTKRPRGVLQK